MKGLERMRRLSEEEYNHSMTELSMNSVLRTKADVGFIVMGNADRFTFVNQSQLREKQCKISAFSVFVMAFSKVVCHAKKSKPHIPI